MDMAQLAAMRRAYRTAGIDVGDLDPNPYIQLERWLKDAIHAELPEPNAMVLATASADGWPSARTVLLKAYDENGLVFYTNYGSRKGRELAENPRACVVFPWHDLDRQVIVAGRVEKVSREETEAYFRTRPHGSQLGAWASRQSEVIPSRDVIERRYAELARRWPEGTQVPVPDFWGGYRLRAERFEFWQGRDNRLHDRLRYRLADGSWLVERLSP
ncbi:pyridoxamine 5'-phosphate oxidase [Carbonactinospora thermoautotrophica]|nr:pyridoxamine 5'-phosphate oxidase [Carbonactinospora thermoautotrophica]